MRLSRVMAAVSALLLLAAWPALADKPSELAEQASRPWVLTDLPELDQILADVNETEPLNNTCPGEPYVMGNVVHAALNPGGDLDWFAFNGPAGGILTIGTDADGTPTADTYISLYRDDCTTVLINDDDSGPGLFSLISNYALPYSGTYYLKVRGFSTSTVGLYKLVGSIQAPFDTFCDVGQYKSQKFEVNLPIPDVNPAGITAGPIVIPADGSTILDVVVDLGIAHTWAGDVTARLSYVLPTGTTSVDLINRPGYPATSFGCSGNLIGTTTEKYYFGTGNLATLGESSCPTNIPLQCYRVAPESPNGLLPFRGLPKGGEWWLFVSDSASGDTGTLFNFSIHLLNEGPVSVESSSWGSVKSSYR